MSLISRLFGSVFLSVALFAGTAMANPGTLQGIVKDANGKVVQNADVRVESKDGTGKAMVSKTDAKGHYVVNGVNTGRDYHVTLLVAGAVKASLSNVRTTTTAPVQELNFNLKKDTSASAGKKKTHMVYVPAQTGSNMGGRWVEVDDTKDSAAALAGTSNVQRGSAAAFGRLQGGGQSHSGGN